MYEHLIHTVFVSEVANFELTEIKNIFKCFGGVDELKVRMLRGYLENVQKGEEAQKLTKLSLHHLNGPNGNAKITRPMVNTEEYQFQDS